jgi:predicted Holliday junction resolvase-like endonuclease
VRNMLVNLIALMIIIITIFFCVIHAEIRNIKAFVERSMNTDNNTDSNTSSFDERELTSYEIERLKRERAFDERILKLQTEVNQYKSDERIAKLQTEVNQYKSKPAEELHPLVHNLPHDVIKTRYDVLPDVEVAE